MDAQPHTSATLFPQRERAIADVRAQLGERAFEATWNEGQAMTLEQMLDFALSLGGRP